MKNILISTESKEEARFLIQLAGKSGFKFLSVSDKEKRMVYRMKLIKLSNQVQK
jgi:hypothetical protein